MGEFGFGLVLGGLIGSVATMLHYRRAVNRLESLLEQILARPSESPEEAKIKGRPNFKGVLSGRKNPE